MVDPGPAPRTPCPGEVNAGKGRETILGWKFSVEDAVGKKAIHDLVCHPFPTHVEQ